MILNDVKTAQEFFIVDVVVVLDGIAEMEDNWLSRHIWYFSTGILIVIS